MTDAPDHIWLQWGGPYGENTFCEDQINNHDVEYVRADLAREYLRLKAENQRLREALGQVAGMAETTRQYVKDSAPSEDSWIIGFMSGLLAAAGDVSRPAREALKGEE